MTKLFNRAFASLPEDVKHDEELYEKISLLQQFVTPENLDIKPNFRNETSWLVSYPFFFYLVSVSIFSSHMVLQTFTVRVLICLNWMNL